jgi:hypothetical protein
VVTEVTVRWFGSENIRYEKKKPIASEYNNTFDHTQEIGHVFRVDHGGKIIQMKSKARKISIGNETPALNCCNQT